MDKFKNQISDLAFSLKIAERMAQYLACMPVSSIHRQVFPIEILANQVTAQQYLSSSFLASLESAKKRADLLNSLDINKHLMQENFPLLQRIEILGSLKLPKIYADFINGAFNAQLQKNSLITDSMSSILEMYRNAVGADTGSFSAFTPDKQLIREQLSDEVVQDERRIPVVILGVIGLLLSSVVGVSDGVVVLSKTDTQYLLQLLFSLFLFYIASLQSMRSQEEHENILMEHQSILVEIKSDIEKLKGEQKDG